MVDSGKRIQQGNSNALIVEWGIKNEVSHLLAEYVRRVDQGDLDGWLELFTDDSTYKVMTRDNYEKGWYVAIMDDNRARMFDRVNMIRSFYHQEPMVYRHVFTPIEMHLESTDRVTALTNFAIYATRRDGLTELLAAGRYFDVVQREGPSWLFRDRLVVVDNSLIVEMPLPL